jgi:hypothetical protein
MPSFRIGRFNSIPDAAWFLARKAREYQEHDHVCSVSELEGLTASRPYCFVLLSTQLKDRMVPFCRFLQNDVVKESYISICLDGHADCDTLAFHLGAEVSPIVDSLEPGTVYFRKGEEHWYCDWPDRPTWIVPSLLLKVCTCLAASQRAFIEGGFKYLAPLRLEDVADMIGCHLSSVSRVIAGVQAQTDWGRVPLKSLFSGSFQTDAGALSHVQVKAAILQLIRNEPKADPLTDQAITQLLGAQGLSISRRTVTKYRIGLGISSTHERAAADER